MAETPLSEPWVCYGQTQIQEGTLVDNPAPNRNGLCGEVTCLPYVVPDGKTLVLKYYGAEAYDFPGTVVMVPWIGCEAISNGACLPSAASKAGTGSVNGEWHLPAGTVLNFRIMQAQDTPGDAPWVFGWGASGHLLSEPADPSS